jgi:hypothetical protein
METPPPLPPREVTYDLTREMAMGLARKPLGGTAGRIRIGLALIVLCMLLAFICSMGDVIAVRAVLIGFTPLYIYIVYRFDRFMEARFKERPDKRTTLSIGADALIIRTDLMATTYRWALIKEVRYSTDLLIIVIRGRTQNIAIPAAALGESLMKVIEEQVTKYGGKVTPPETRKNRVARTASLIVLSLVGLILVTGAFFAHSDRGEGSFDAIKMGKLVDQVRQQQFDGTQEFHWAEEFGEPKLLVGPAPGYQLWAERTPDQSLKVVFVTRYNPSWTVGTDPAPPSHGAGINAWGFAYSDDALTPTDDGHGMSTLPLPGPLHDTKMDFPIMGHWWRVSDGGD